MARKRTSRKRTSRRGGGALSGAVLRKLEEGQEYTVLVPTSDEDMQAKVGSAKTLAAARKIAKRYIAGQVRSVAQPYYKQILRDAMLDGMLIVGRGYFHGIAPR